MFTMMIKGKECSKDEENLSAKEKTEKKRTWIQKENEVSKWKKCFKEKTADGRRVLARRRAKGRNRLTH